MIKSLREKLHKLCEEMKPMSTIEKLDHIWTYFKAQLYIALLVVFFLIAGIIGIANANRPVLLSGVVVNALDLDAHTFISAGYAHHKGSDAQVDITTVLYSASEEESAINDTYNYVVKVISMVELQQVDFLIMDKVGMEGYMRQDFFIDLRQILTQEELAALESELVYMEYMESGQMMPVAIRLNNTAFGARFLKEGEYFISFAANTKRPEECRGFWEYMIRENNDDLGSN